MGQGKSQLAIKDWELGTIGNKTGGGRGTLNVYGSESEFLISG
jgi:hypothetical protein